MIYIWKKIFIGSYALYRDKKLPCFDRLPLKNKNCLHSHFKFLCLSSSTQSFKIFKALTFFISFCPVCYSVVIININYLNYTHPASTQCKIFKLFTLKKKKTFCLLLSIIVVNSFLLRFLIFLPLHIKLKNFFTPLPPVFYSICYFVFLIIINYQ